MRMIRYQNNIQATKNYVVILTAMYYLKQEIFV